jgi:hypothetical protein
MVAMLGIALAVPAWRQLLVPGKGWHARSFEFVQGTQQRQQDGVGGGRACSGGHAAGR